MRGRREVLQVGLAMLAGSQMLGAWAADKSKDKDRDEPKPPPPPLTTKAVPSTGERLAVIGVGTNNYSPTTPEERQARREVLSGLTAAGASIIDTAPAYRQSEAVIGDLLADIGNRRQAFIATKVTADGKLEQGVAMIRESMRRLKTDVLDLVQIHSLNGVDVLFPHLEELKRKGQVRYIGITTSSSSQHDAMVQVIKSQPLDFIQVDYSLANRAAAEDVLPAALERRIGVLINLPFGGRRDGNLFSRVRGAELPDWAAEIDAKSWGQVFLKYVVSHPAVTAAIPGMTKLEHLEDNLGAARGRMPDAAMRARMERYWDSRSDG
ncbi:MAG TPA: aldo/keto reductase [Steroidobacteraceae bacterium]|nr:aldo/keto reductase [Steroidobacteraceae bacterium]